MSDDLDDLLRRSMKTLDDQVPSGYFEALPNRTLARLEENNMQLGQTTGEGTAGSNMSTGVPPQADRDEDSGLHDIRSLASSTKLRLSSRRSTQNPVPVDDEVLASSSAGWKVVALPEPAKMVSLPELAELPPVREIKEQAKDSKRAAQEARKAEKAAAAAAAAEAKAAAAAPVAATPVVAVEARPAAPAVEPSTPVIGARFAQQKKSKAPIVAVVGLGLAAAAGGVFYVTTQNKEQAAKPDVVASGEREEGAKRAADEPPAAPPVAAPAATQAIATGDAASSAGAPAEELAVTAANDVTETSKAPSKADRRGKGKAIDKQANAEVEVKKAEPKDKQPPKPEKTDTKTGGGEGEPSFDQLLKEAGVDNTKKVVKPKLDKTQLTSDDIKKGMSALTGKAKACYSGTEGTANVRLTVAPSGQVQKVTVTGVFKGTPVAACIESAVRAATFPPWDGGPQTFGYSYLLSE